MKLYIINERDISEGKMKMPQLKWVTNPNAKYITHTSSDIVKNTAEHNFVVRALGYVPTHPQPGIREWVGRYRKLSKP